jgi:hypothetical protein
MKWPYKDQEHAISSLLLVSLIVCDHLGERAARLGTSQYQQLLTIAAYPQAPERCSRTGRLHRLADSLPYGPTDIPRDARRHHGDILTALWSDTISLSIAALPWTTLFTSA